MKTLTLGKGALVVTRLAYGCWRLAGTWEKTAVTPDGRVAGRKAVQAAFEAGYTLFDLADVYCDGVAEEIFGEALAAAPGMRDRVVLAGKCGIRKKGEPRPEAPYRYDFSGGYILESCDASLKRLGVETIDLYQLHRPDFLMQPEEVAAAFTQLKAAGKVREFGVSNFSPSQFSLLQRACPMPLVVNQVQINLAKLDAFSDGTLDQCLAAKITPLAWSPLGGGGVANNDPIDMRDPQHARRLHLRETLDHVARDRGVSRMVIALAWLMRHPAHIVPIFGSTRPERIQDAVLADGVELSREEWYRVLEAARGERLP